MSSVGLNCVNCGAPMELVESRRYFRCRHCGSFSFPEPIEVEGVRIFGTAPDAPACPVCRHGMAAATLDDKHPVHFCGTCRGILMPRATFAHVVTTRRAWAVDPAVEAPPLDRQALTRQLACPKCGGRFATYAHYGPGNVVIDNCTTCDMIWLDFGELRQIVAAPGKDRGSRDVPRVENVRWASDGAVGEPEGEDALGFLVRMLLGR